MDMVLAPRSAINMAGENPDMTCAVRVLSRFNATPSEAHMTAAKCVCRYLKGTIILQLVYTGEQVCEAIGYSDADWASSLDDRRSTSGMIASGAVSWPSRIPSTDTCSPGSYVDETTTSKSGRDT